MDSDAPGYSFERVHVWDTQSLWANTITEHNRRIEANPAYATGIELTFNPPTTVTVRTPASIFIGFNKKYKPSLSLIKVKSGYSQFF